MTDTRQTKHGSLVRHRPFFNLTKTGTAMTETILDIDKPVHVRGYPRVSIYGNLHFVREHWRPLPIRRHQTKPKRLGRPLIYRSPQKLH